MLKNKNKLFLLLALVAAAFTACDKMEDSYMDYAKDGEIVYIGKADSVQTFSGRNRIKVSWLLVSDPKITTCKVFWNEKRDSVVQDVQRSGGKDYVEVVLPNMPEQSFTFEVYNYDSKGQSSVKTEALGTVYGDRYASTISNRTLKTAVFANDSAKIEWYAASNEVAAMEFTYVDKNGVEKKVRQEKVPNASNPKAAWTMPLNTYLLGYKKGNAFSYRTLYLPTETAIDTFYTPVDSRIVN